MPRNAFDPLTGRLAYISPLSEEPVIYRQLIAERGRPGLDGTLVHVPAAIHPDDAEVAS